MLLGTTAKEATVSGTEPLILQLLLQLRYAEAYELLLNQKPAQQASIYNMALCLHWSGNYQEALNRLDSIQLSTNLANSSQLHTNSDYKQIRSKQNQTNDYLQGISEAYIRSFPAFFRDMIIRFKTDCWLQLDNYAKVIAIAGPIANKGYKDITDALKQADTIHDKRV